MVEHILLFSSSQSSLLSLLLLQLCCISLYLWALLILQAFNHFTYVTAHSDSPSFMSLHLHHNSFSNPSLALPTSQLILQPFRCFTYVTAHSPTLLLLLLCSFSKLSVTSPMSQLILQPFPRFTYITAHSPTLLLLHLRHSSVSNPYFASPTSQNFHLYHLASRPCIAPLIVEWGGTE